MLSTRNLPGKGKNKQTIRPMFKTKLARIKASAFRIWIEGKNRAGFSCKGAKYTANWHKLTFALC
jgi:hypothetical protein